MSLLATLVLAWGAVHVFVAAMYAYLFARSGGGREYGAFSILSLALALYCVGSAGVADAVDAAEAVGSQRLQFCGAAIALGAFGTLASELIHRGASRLERATHVWGVLGLGLNMAGLFFDPAQTSAPRAVVAFAPEYHGAPLTPVGLTYSAVGVLFAGGFAVPLWRRRLELTDLRPLQVVVVVSCAAFMADVLAGYVPLRTVLLFEHSSLLASVLVSYMLLRRFVQAGDELARRSRELRRSYAELRLVQAELVRKEQLAAVGELSAVIAHEVRNPLAVLKNATAGLRRESLDEDSQKALLAILDEETDRLNRLVRDLLAYARPVQIQATALPIGATIERALGVARASNPRAQSVTFDVDLTGCPETVSADRDLLERALANIVENALQAMSDDGTMSIRGHEADLEGIPAVALSFHDTGEGMDTLVRSRARDPFFTTRPSGTGLGLAIVERVVRAHGGSLEINSRKEGGTTVMIVLPRTRGPDSEPPTPRGSVPGDLSGEFPL